MKKSEGFTLVEVILSLAILGIISVVFLGSIATHYRFMKSSVEITHNDFKAQEIMELEIDEAKVRVVKPGATLKAMDIFKSDLGGIKVEYEELTVSHNNKDYFALVSNVKVDPLEVIYLESLNVKLMQGTLQVLNDYYGYATTGFNITGDFKNHNNFKFDHLLNQVEWYVSSDKYNIPLPKVLGTALDDSEYHYYPVFPKDYEIYSNETVYKYGASVSTFTNLEHTAGRHIIYTVTPAAKSGKLGIQSISKPIYISGLPITKNLVSHLDASYIDYLSSTTTEAKNVSGKFLLKTWYDLSSIIGRNLPSASAFAVSDNDRPTVRRSSTDDKFIGQYVEFIPSKIMQIQKDGLINPIITYTVIRNRDKTQSSYLINGIKTLSIAASSDEDINQWKIVRAEFTPNTKIFKFGGSNTDIAEILMYSNNINVEENQKIVEYLSGKYFTNNIIFN